MNKFISFFSRFALSLQNNTKSDIRYGNRTEKWNNLWTQRPSAIRGIGVRGIAAFVCNLRGDNDATFDNSIADAARHRDDELPRIDGALRIGCIHIHPMQEIRGCGHRTALHTGNELFVHRTDNSGWNGRRTGCGVRFVYGGIGSGGVRGQHTEICTQDHHPIGVWNCGHADWSLSYKGGDIVVWRR